MQDYYGLEIESRHLIRRRRGEAERERLVRLTTRRRRAFRPGVAEALRALAERLDDEPRPGHEGRLATAR
jgi:hypothetical protein